MLTYPSKKNINKLFVIFILCLMSLWIYKQTLGFEFLNYDDQVYIKYFTTNFSGGINKNNLRELILGFVNGNWHPVTMLSFLSDYLIGGNQIATIYHCHNLVLHTINVIIVFLLIFRLTNALWRSALVAVLFCIHPINIESVAWISERKGLLSAFFLFITIWFYISYIKIKNRKFLILSLIFYVLSLLSKPIGLSLPLILLLIDFWPLQRIKDNLKIKEIIPLIIEKVPYILLALVIGTISVFAQDEAGALKPIEHFPIHVRIYNIITSYLFYALKTISPYNLSPFYPHPTDFSVIIFLTSLISILSITYITWRMRLSYPYLFIGWLWYLIWLIPVIGIVPVGAHVMANRYAYIPTVGLFIIAIWGINDLTNKIRLKKYIITIAAALIFVMYALISKAHISVWKNNFNLWEYSYTHTEKNYITGYYYAHALFYQGKHIESLELFYSLLNLGDRRGALLAITNYTHVLIKHGLITETKIILNRAIENNIIHATIYRELGLLELEYFNNEDVGLDLIYNAISLNDSDMRSHHILGIYFTNKGEYLRARKHLYIALALDNESEKIHQSLSKLMLKLGDTKEAEKHKNLAEKYRSDTKSKSNDAQHIGIDTP